MIPLFAVGTYIYRWGVNNAQERIFETMHNQTFFYLTGFEEDMRRIRLQLYNCMNNEDLRNLAFLPGPMNNYEQIRAMRRFSQVLLTINNASPYISDVRIHITAIDRTISANGGIGPFDTEHFRTCLEIYDLGRILFFAEDDLTMAIVFPITGQALRNESVIRYMITVTLSHGAIGAALRQFTDYNGGGVFMMYDNDLVVAAFYECAEDIQGISNHFQGGSGIHSQTQMIEIEGTQFLTSYVHSPWLNMSVIKYSPADMVYTAISNYRFWLWLFLVGSALIIFVLWVSSHWLIYKPVYRLIQAFKQVEEGDLTTTISINRSDEFGYLYTRFDQMLGSLNSMVEQVYTQKIMIQRAELKHLQSQINPHFLYNSFFLLYNIAQAEGSESVVDLSERLGRYFRYITRDANDEVPLREEIEHARAYGEIQEMRFSNRICVHYGKIPSKYEWLLVPRLILQPLLENAFEHGFSETTWDGELHLSFAVHEDRLKIVVEDNGQGIDSNKISDLNIQLANSSGTEEITGLVNIHKRIVLMYGEDNGLRLISREGGGLRVELIITLPKKIQE